MKIGVSASINVKDIEKARLIKGKKGTYLSFTTFIDIDNKDQYDNNGMITQDVSKEERDSGVQGPILGNCKVFWSDGAQPQQNYAPTQAPPPPQNQPQGAHQQAPAMDAPGDAIPF